MPFTTSGKHYNLHSKRLCKNCKSITEQHAVSCRYRALREPKVPPVYLKELRWYCEGCDETVLVLFLMARNRTTIRMRAATGTSQLAFASENGVVCVAVRVCVVETVSVCASGSVLVDVMVMLSNVHVDVLRI